MTRVNVKADGTGHLLVTNVIALNKNITMHVPI